MRHLASISMEDTGRMVAENGQAYRDLLSKSLELGWAIEQDDDSPLVSTRYTFTTIHLPETLLYSLRVQIFLLRMHYDLASLYDLPEQHHLFDRFRGLCTEMWKYIPFLKGVESFIGAMLQPGLYPTLEIVEGSKREHLLNVFAELDKYRHSSPRDRASLEKRIMSYVLVLTGRVPLPSSP
jgi:hypothetical protein